MLSFPWQEDFKIEKVIDKEREKVTCPYCGHRVNAFQDKDAICRGVFFKCKNRKCGRIFELKL